MAQKAASQTRRQRLVADAMAALSTDDPRARRWTIALAARYRRMTGPRGVYTRAATFSDLRQALEKERDTARKLAWRMTVITRRMPVVLKRLTGNDASVADAILGRRVEFAQNLYRHADEIQELMKSPWPKGGAWNLAKEHLGTPKQWLVDQCVRVFFHYGDTQAIRATSSSEGKSPFADYVDAIYELATDQEASGLSKIIDETARRWRRNEAKKA